MYFIKYKNSDERKKLDVLLGLPENYKISYRVGKIFITHGLKK